MVRERILLGLKHYIKIAEKDRINFHSAPGAAAPELFEKLLPYAMIFGLEKKWAKQFEGIYTSPPTWYQGSNGAFSAALFASELSSFSHSPVFQAPSVSSWSRSSGGSSSSSSSGSSGGGSSGGGGGGGGGGSW